MRKNKFIYIIFSLIMVAGIACKKQLQVGNPNAPTVSDNIVNQAGLAAFSQGATFSNGFVFLNTATWLGNSYFSLEYGYSELLADVIGADAANCEISVVSVPDYVIPAAGIPSIVNNSQQIPFLRSYNTRANTGAGNNVFYYQWLNMYALNAAENLVIHYANKLSPVLSADAANTFLAWAYWWKGYAYASVGSQYYSGLIVDEYDSTKNNGTSVSNNAYKIKDSIIARSNYYFNLASTTLASISSGSSDYNTVLGQLIPSDFQQGNGGIPTPAQWIRSINTMLARNILVNKLNPFDTQNGFAKSITKSSTSNMTPADWANVLQYATNGIQMGDIVFTGHAGSVNPIFTAAAGTASALTAGKNQKTVFKISERFIQDFNPSDARLANNFDMTTFYGNTNFSTRYSLSNGGNGAAGVWVYGNLTPDNYEAYIASSYEENEMILAEANIMSGQIDKGLSYVDAVRSYQGAGVPNVSGTGLNQAQAMTELVKERRASLVFRGLSWYDARRWGWSYAIANGGGSYGNVFVGTDGTVYNNATISYGFLDYWDVPADESVLNPPGTGSAATVNPNF